MTRLYLHIGMPKTGSTSIQGTFAAAREHLASHGVGYFRLGSNHSSILNPLFGKVKKGGLPPFLCKALGIEPRATNFDRAALTRLLDDELAANTLPKFVMSGEALFQFKRENVEDLKRHMSRFFDDIRIVVYVRDPVAWASSRAQNAVKQSAKTLDELCDPKRIAARKSVIVPLYRAGIEPYVDAFGRDAVDIRVFDRDRLVGGDLIADFCAAIGEPGLAAGLPRSIMNPSLSYEAILLIDRYKKVVAERGGRLGGRDLLAFRRLVEDLEGTRFALPRETLRLIRASVADDLAWLRDMLGAEAFRAEDRSAEADLEPAWSRSTLRRIAALINPEDAARLREALGSDIDGDAVDRPDANAGPAMPEARLRQIVELIEAASRRRRKKAKKGKSDRRAADAAGPRDESPRRTADGSAGLRVSAFQRIRQVLGGARLTK